MFTKKKQEKLRQRLMTRVYSSDTHWLYTGPKTAKGTQRACADGRTMDIKRAMYIATYGSVPEGYSVKSGCDCSGCVNPDHLRLMEGARQPKASLSNPAYIARKRADFIGKVSKESSGCWIWQGGFAASGYGMFSLVSTPVYAHRVSFEFFRGRKIPTGKVVRHICDDKRCVNPDHLILGTHADNKRDHILRGSCPNWTLGHVSAKEIRALKAAGMSNVALAAKYRVSLRHVYRVVSGQAW